MGRLSRGGFDVGVTPFRAGYVEAVAVAPGHQRSGLGTAVMAALAAVIHERFELGVLSSGEWGFYERLGWSAGAARATCAVRTA